MLSKISQTQKKRVPFSVGNLDLKKETPKQEGDSLGKGSRVAGRELGGWSPQG